MRLTWGWERLAGWLGRGQEKSLSNRGSRDHGQQGWEGKRKGKEPPVENDSWWSMTWNSAQKRPKRGLWKARLSLFLTQFLSVGITWVSHSAWLFGVFLPPRLAKVVPWTREFKGWWGWRAGTRRDGEVGDPCGIGGEKYIPGFQLKPRPAACPAVQPSAGSLCWGFYLPRNFPFYYICRMA